MRIKEIMTPTVISIRSDQSLLEVRELMLSNNLRRIPVTHKEGLLMGIVTDGDVSRATPSDASVLDRYEANYLLGKLKVSDIMTKSVWTVRESDSVETAAYLLYTHKVGALPVVDGTNHITGIISDTDIFKAFVDIMGYNQTSTKVVIDTKDKVGVIAELSQIFTERGVNIISILSRTLAGDEREVTIRADLTQAMDIVERIRDAGYDIKEVSTLRVEAGHEG